MPWSYPHWIFSHQWGKDGAQWLVQCRWQQDCLLPCCNLIESWRKVWLNFVGNMTNKKSFDVLDCEQSNINHMHCCFQKMVVCWKMLVEPFDIVIRIGHLRLLLLLAFLWWFFGCHWEELSWSWEMMAHKACNLIVLLQWCCSGDVELGVVKLCMKVCRMLFLRSMMSQCSQIDDNCAQSTQNWTYTKWWSTPWVN